MTDSATSSPGTRTVLILFFCLLVLVMLLILLYKKLNKEANGKYTIRNMVYKEGGIRDRARGAALALGSRLGVQLWPHSETDEDGEEMQEVRDEEGQVEEGGSQGSDSEGDDQEDEKETTDAGQYGKTNGKGGDTSDDRSSLDGSEAGERTRLTDQGATGEEGKEKSENDGEGISEASGGAELSIDLKQFSGSAIWSEEEGSKDGDVTAL